MDKDNDRVLCECTQCESQVRVGRSTRWAHLKKFGKPTLLTQTFEDFSEKTTDPFLNTAKANTGRKRHRQPEEGKKKARARPLHDAGVTLQGVNSTDGYSDGSRHYRTEETMVRSTQIRQFGC